MQVKNTRDVFDLITKKIYPLALIAIAVLFVIFVISIVRTALTGDVELHKYAFFEISLLLLIAVLAEIGVIYSKQPTAILLLVVGILMSESVLHLDIFRDKELLYLFAQLGAIFLLFKVGLHSHFKTIFSTDNAVVATLGVVIPFLGGFTYATLTGGNFIYSMFLGAALTATSVGVTVAIIKEAGLLNQKFAQVIIGAAVIDDVLGLLVLSFVLNVPSGYELPQIIGLFEDLFIVGITPQFSSFAAAVGKTMLSTLVFLGGGIIVGKKFIKTVIDKIEMNNTNFLIVLAFLHFYSYVAEVVGLSAIVGAFLAGLLLTSSRHVKEIEEKVYPLETTFVPIFFISLGLLVNINELFMFIVPIIIISVIAILTKTVGCGVGALMSKMSVLESAIVGVGMSPRAEVALIVAAIGLQRGVLHSSEYAIISAMALVTTLIPPFFMNMLIAKLKVKK
jgi:Kef-type K+ transport system membrane component KefB